MLGPATHFVETPASMAAIAIDDLHAAAQPFSAMRRWLCADVTRLARTSRTQAWCAAHAERGRSVRTLAGLLLCGWHMSRTVYDTEPLPTWMRGRLSIRQSDPRWFRRATGPDAIDLQKISKEVAAIMKQQAVQPRTARSPEVQPCRATPGPNQRRAAAATAARARWSRTSPEQRLKVGARLRAARQRRVKLLPASLVEGLVVINQDTAALVCARCHRAGERYVRTLDVRAPVLLRCRRHAYLRPGE
jgi:hypothetical protein